MQIKAAMPHYSVIGATDVAWLDNNRFVVVEGFQSYPMYDDSWDYIATVYDADYHQVSQFVVPVPSTMLQETGRPLMVTPLPNGNLLFVGEASTAGLGVVITTDEGVEVTAWHTISPNQTGYLRGDVVVLDNGNVVVSSLNANSNYPLYQPRHIILDQNGNTLGEADSLTNVTNQSVDGYGIAATSFGFAVLFASQGGAASPSPAILGLYDFAGHLLSQQNLDTDANNPFGPATNPSFRGTALARVQGDVLYAGVRRRRENPAPGPSWDSNVTASSLPVQDIITSGLRKMEVSASGVITMLNEIELSKRELGLYGSMADQFAALPDGRLFAVASALPDLASIEFRGNTSYDYGSAFPVISFDTGGNQSDITNIVLEPISRQGHTYSPPGPWVDYDYYQDPGAFPQNGTMGYKLLASPDGRRLLVQMLYYGLDGGAISIYNLLFDISSGQFVPVTRTLLASNRPQWLPKMFSIFALEERVSTVEFAIVNGAGSGDLLACPACGVPSTHITGNYDSGAKTLTMIANPLTVSTAYWTEKLRYLTFAPDGAGTRTLAVTMTNAYGDSYTETFDFAVDAAP